MKLAQLFGKAEAKDSSFMLLEGLPPDFLAQGNSFYRLMQSGCYVPVSYLKKSQSCRIHNGVINIYIHLPKRHILYEL